MSYIKCEKKLLVALDDWFLEISTTFRAVTMLVLRKHHRLSCESIAYLYSMSVKIGIYKSENGVKWLYKLV